MRWNARWKRWRRLPIIVLVVMLTGCASSPTTGARVFTPTATAAPTFPAFADWRVAYISQDGRLHAVSLDGETDLAGAVIATTNASSGSGAWTAGTAPDGQRLAFGNTADVFYIDLSNDQATSFQTFQTRSTAMSGFLFWSPDGQHIAIDGSQGNIHIITLATGAATTLPVPTQPQGYTTASLVGQVYGWLDNTHLAVDYFPGELAPVTTPSRSTSPQIAANLYSLEIPTGALRPVVTVRSSTMISGSFSLAPDRSEALFFNTQVTGEGAPATAYLFRPMADRVNVATGAVTPLPHIASLISQTNHVYDEIYQVLWIPHTHRALVTLVMGDQVTGNDIIDVDTDSVTPIQLASFPVAWAPDGKTLVLSSVPRNGDGEGGPGPTGSGPFTLSAVTFDPAWNPSQTVTLTHEAMQIPTLGFVRTT